MEQITTLRGIEKDTLEGLSSNPKYLLPRYFYDDRGSQIFQNIMRMPEYYLTDCENEIFQEQKADIYKAVAGVGDSFQLIEFGSGDGLKTKILLKHFLRNKAKFNYIPIDISAHANAVLEADLKKNYPELDVQPRTGDYFDVMHELVNQPYQRKVILFLGANIGNYNPDEVNAFFSHLANLTEAGDRLLIGFDLKKSPAIILKAYSDPHGYTRDFNINHLDRLNRELGANFKIENFEQHTEYNPLSGAVRSFMVSKIEQEVYVAALDEVFHFAAWEPIFMELSQKYDYQMIDNLAAEHGFSVEKYFTDHRGYFVDSLWIRK